MAAPRRLSDNVVLAPNPVLTTPQTSLVAIRCASKKSGGSSKNLGGRSPGKRYGFKKVEGRCAFVHAGNILATQWLIRWHPGAHVEMGCNKTLYALEDGTVRYTKEVYIPPPRSSESREVICRLPKGAVLYKTFISVDPTIEVESFKLVTSVLSQLAYPAGDTTPGASLNLPLKSLQSGCRSQRAIGVGAHSDALMRVHSAAHT